MLPTFIIAGASKSGTTSLWEYLKAHPQVCMASIKETQFFSTEPPSGRYNKGLDWYISLFQPPIGVKAIGEATPSYMVKDDTPRLIAQTIPGVQLLFLLRDPVDRLYSQYWFRRQQGVPLPDFDELVNSRAGDIYPPQLEKLIYASSYHLHLARYLDRFPKEQVAVLLYEDMRQNPQEFIHRICQIIGVEPGVIPPNIHKRYNTARRVKFARFQRLLKALGPGVMSMEMPGWLFSTLKIGRKTLWNMNTSVMQNPPIQPAIRLQLINSLSAAIEYVETYLNRPLPEWRKT